MTCRRICNKRNTTDAPIGTGTASPSGAPEFTPSCCGIRVQWPKEEGQTIQWPKEEGQTIQWPKEEGQTIQWPKKFI
jgi:hypothetical protein